MTKKEATKQLNIGYVLFASGIMLGILIHKNVKYNIFSSAMMFGYFFWATFWGYKIMYSKFSSFFNSPVHIETKGIGDYLKKTIFFKYTTEFIKFFICYCVGALGGGIIKQIQLSKIAYF